MNSLLYAVNGSAQNITASQTINFGLPIRRYGRNINTSGLGILVKGEGYYPINANVSGVSGGAGIVGVQLYENGVAIPGAIASVTVASGATFSLTIPTTIRIRCCEEKIITAALLTVDAEIGNASILVEKA